MSSPPRPTADPAPSAPASSPRPADGFELLFEHGPDGVFIACLEQPLIWDEDADKDALTETMLEDLRITHATAALGRQLGLPVDDIVGTSPCTIWPHSSDHLGALLRRLCDEDRVEMVEPRCGPDGVPRTIEATYVCLRDSAGRVAGYASIQRDVTDRVAREVRLRATEMRLAETQAIAKVGDFTYDFASERSVWSDELFRIHGIPVGPLGPSHDRLIQLMHPDDRERMGAILSDPEGAPAFELFRCVRPDGEVRRLSLKTVVERGDDGQPRRLVGTVHDVTDLQEALEVAARREAQLQHLFANSSEGVFLMTLDRPIAWDPTASDRAKDELLDHMFDRLRLTEINDAACRQIGARRDQLLGMSARERWGHEPDGWRERMRPLCDQGKIHFLGESHRHDGSPYRAEGDYVCVYDGEGLFAGYFGVQRDVTARELASEALRRSRERLQLALDGGNMMVWDWNPETRQAFSEGQHASVLGYPPEELAAILERGGWHDELIHPDDRPLHHRLQAEHLAGKTPVYQHEFRVRRADGEYIWLSSHGRVTERDPDGRALRLVGVAQDVTERRRMEERLRRAENMASLGTLAAGVAHEVNNPLAFVVGNLEHLAARLARADRGIPAEEVAELQRVVDDSLRGAERMRDIVRDLRTLAQGDGATIGPVNVDGVLDMAIQLTGNHIHERARLSWRRQPLPQVRGSQTRLGQVFVNLLMNAAQSIAPGHPEDNLIQVTTRSAQHGRVVIEVRDSGRGMAPELVSRIFDPFFTTKEVGEGMGLGLSICHTIVSDLGGDIRVNSSPGRGTCFEVELPVAEPETMTATAAAPPWPQPTAHPAEPPAVPASRRRILVIDDEPLAGQMLVRLLEAHDVVAETRATDALSRVNAGERFDRVLCDLMMPGMSGLALYHQLPDEVRRRVVFMTGGAFSAEAAAFLASVPNPRLEKPFQLDELEAVLGFRLT